MKFYEAKAIADHLGFQVIADVRGDTNAGRLFTKDLVDRYGKGNRCGVYMLFRTDGAVYIGQSRDVDRRFKSHRVKGTLIDYMAFRYWPPKLLLEKEDACIRDAEALGLPLTNKTEIKCGLLRKEEDYDDIFPPSEQDQFIASIAARQNPLSQWPNVCKNASRAETIEWDKFTLLPRFTELYRIAALYLKTTVLQYEDTEDVCWQSALFHTSKSKGSYRPIIRLRCGNTETFTLYHFNQAREQYFVRILIAPDIIYEALDALKPGHSYLPWASLDLPQRRPSPTVGDMMQAGMLKPEKRTTGTPSADAELLTRPIALVDTSNLGCATIPFDAVEATLSDDTFATAAAMANIACMRSQMVESSDHNSLLAFRMLYL